MTGAGNWTYLVRGPRPILIDAGVGNAAHVDAVASAVPTGPVDVLVTHAHGDHASGAPVLAARWPGVRLSKRPWPERDGRYSVPWHPMADGDRVDTGETALTAVHTPGHAPDHLAFWDPVSRTLFSGDLVVAGTTVVIPASSGGDLAAYLASLRRVLALQPARLLPAHGDAIEDPPAIIDAYLRHREEREAQVLTALSDGLDGIDAIVALLYPGLITPLVPMARESILAHLMKLAHDGRVTSHGDAWSLTGA